MVSPGLSGSGLALTTLPSGLLAKPIIGVPGAATCTHGPAILVGIGVPSLSEPALTPPTVSTRSEPPYQGGRTPVYHLCQSPGSSARNGSNTGFCPHPLSSVL